MAVDNHPKECRAMKLFKQGKSKEAGTLQDEFVEEIMSSGEDLCSCPGACKFHGKCVECVAIHRGHGDHLPHCFYDMVNERLDAVSSLTEHIAKPNK